MNRRALYLLVFACLIFVGGCAYNRYDGWHWETKGMGRQVIDLAFSVIPDGRTPRERMEDDADEFFNE